MNLKKIKKQRNLPVVEGTIQLSREGYAFVRIKDEEDAVFINKNKVCGALSGDTVKIKITKEKTDSKSREGEVIEIIERSKRPFVGILHVVGNQAWVIMQSKFMPYDIKIDIEEPNHPAKDGSIKILNEDTYIINGLNIDGKPAQVNKGMKVAAIVDSWDKKEMYPHGKIVDVLGQAGENNTEMHAILTEYGLPYRFEKEIEDAADSISEKITKEDIKNRRDFRDVMTFTIDPIDAKDFDDALSFEKLPNGNFEVGVHIADVSYYVTPNSILDKEAQSRGTSVYLVDRTVPMLPEKLSNKLCSLRPNEEKLTFSAVFELDKDAKIVNYWLGRTVIKSNYRFAYDTAQQIIDAGENSLNTEMRGGTDGYYKASPNSLMSEAAMMGEGATTGCLIPKDIKEAILILWDLAKALKTKRFKEGAISFERPEMKVLVDEKGKPINVYQKISKEANWLIEEFMLLANRTVAEFIATDFKMDHRARKNPRTFVYRIHDEPDLQKLEGVREFATSFGYKPKFENSNGKQIAKAINNLLGKAKDKPEFMALEMLALRSMAKACYSVDNIGHYGLAFKFYTHFTSPIRRYPDTMVHRLLAMYLEGAKSQDKEYYSKQCKYASERELIAANAERDSIKYKLIEFMQDKLGLEFEGRISGLTEFGMFVEVEPTKIEGMVPLRDVKEDWFEYDEKQHTLIGKRTKKVYKLGDYVKIKVKTANVEQRFLDYELITENTDNSKEKSKSSKNKYSKSKDSKQTQEKESKFTSRKDKIRNSIKANKEKKKKNRKS